MATIDDLPASEKTSREIIGESLEVLDDAQDLFNGWIFTGSPVAGRMLRIRSMPLFSWDGSSPGRVLRGERYGSARFTLLSRWSEFHPIAGRGVNAADPQGATSYHPADGHAYGGHDCP